MPSPRAQDGRAAGHDPRIYVSETGLQRLRRRGDALPGAGRAPAWSTLQGQRAARLRGRGLAFEELRAWQPGDEARDIDWRVTARRRSPYVRIYAEERNRPVLLLVDQRMGMFFGSVLNTKSVAAAEAAALLAWQGVAAGDRIGGIVFGDAGRQELRPHCSERAVLALLHRLAASNQALHAALPAGDPQATLRSPLQAAARIARHDHLVVIISDCDGFTEDMVPLLAGLARHNDLVLMLVEDPLLVTPPPGLRLRLSDGRSSRRVDLARAGTREALQLRLEASRERILDLEHVLQVPVLGLDPSRPTAGQLGQRAPRRPPAGSA